MIEQQAEAPSNRPRGRRRAWLVPALEIGVVITLVLVVTVSVLIVRGSTAYQAWLTPPTVAALIVANLVPAMALMVLIARRVAKRRAARLGLGEGRLHVRLVVLFSIIASIPTLLVVAFASVLFQSSQEFWFSDRWRGSVENAVMLNQEAFRREVERVEAEAVTMATDVSNALSEVTYDDPAFSTFLTEQLWRRNLSEGIILAYSPQSGIRQFVLVNPYGERDLERVIGRQVYSQLREPLQSATIRESNRVGVLVKMPGADNLYLYAARVYGEDADVQPRTAEDAATLRFENSMIEQMRRGEALRADYLALSQEARSLQFRFNAAILAVSILIVGLAIWVALALADRLVVPVGALVVAARRISEGDLAARVPQTKAADELRTLGDAFNTMTDRLEEQTQALESRRAFTEAVLGGVTAGVISVDGDLTVRLANATAESLLRTGGPSPVGQKLTDLAPELAVLLTDRDAENIVQFTTRGEPRTLAVKTVAVDGGHVLTFDDITEQLLDQRRAAWSDVARRIAHEIKNPLTPIQLAAERLQRRYGKEITSDLPTFEKLTGTIVRQVGDLRRMVDEFSSFARMPKPNFGEEAIADIARQALFLHEVAHPDIRFSLDAPEPSPILVCDRRLLGQALTNIVKNGVEAIAQKRDEGGDTREARVSITIREAEEQLVVEVTDTGVGLPADRGRLTEPYMTTRQKGTGLGLAIVKKIVEDHLGRLEFADAAGGGTCVRLVFDPAMLARIGAAGVRYTEEHAANG